MSDLRIGLVAEGETDYVIIEAALKAILPIPFVMNLLQPDKTYPKTGGGWCGVNKWCSAYKARGASSLKTDTTLQRFDLIILHVDADIAEKNYADCGKVWSSDSAHNKWTPLPTANLPCPPVHTAINIVSKAILSWLGITALDACTVLCIPSKASEAWLIAAAFSPDHRLQQNIECHPKLETALAALPKSERIRKCIPEYRKHAKTITANWEGVTRTCSQAGEFTDSISAALACYHKFHTH